MNIRHAAVVAALPILALGAASPALAQGGGGNGGGGGGGVRAAGPCATGTWNLKAKLDDGRVKVEAEIDTNRVGQTWTWRLSDNNTRFASDTSRTVAPSGSFSVERSTANRAGADTVRLFATNAGRQCSGSVTLP